MSDLGTNALNVGSCSTTEHIFPWKWNLSDLPGREKHGHTVFSCFSCGGGSTMGYKLAGYDVIGNCEIDPQMMELYRKNHNPRHSFLMDVRDFSRLPDSEMPDELMKLDILDGSPPCSVFSTTGAREKGWNTEKVFREGQKKQRLDDLFLWFIEVVGRLQPKVVVAENVKGILLGNAKGHVNAIIKALDAAGYAVQIFLLDSQVMGVPQRRERVFFIARRKDLPYSKLKLVFSEPSILFGEVRAERGRPIRQGKYAELLEFRKSSDTCIADISARLGGKESGFTDAIMADERVAATLTSSGSLYRMCDGLRLSGEDCINIQTFPQDYDFLGKSEQYVCGMSVPPVMMAQIARQIYLQWLIKGDSDDAGTETAHGCDLSQRPQASE